jgi:hypothetical protein
MASTKIAFYSYYLLIISPGIYVYYMVFAKKIHMGTLGAKTSQWRPGHVPYLPYPRNATAFILRHKHQIPTVINYLV